MSIPMRRTPDSSPARSSGSHASSASASLARAAPRAARAVDATSAADVTSPALRLIGLLEHVSRADKAQTLTEIIAEVRQPKPTVYRMLQQLEQAALLVKE